jgi:hypothetical protein
MPTVLPVEEASRLDNPAVPIPVCMGVPPGLWFETFQNEEDTRQFWRGYAIGGVVCSAILALEIMAIAILL